MMALVAIQVSGCAHLGCQPSTSSPGCNSVSDQPQGSLPVILFDSRSNISLSNVTNPIEGFPLVGNLSEAVNEGLYVPTHLRDLRYEELLSIAADASPVANKLEAWRQWLCSLNRTSPATLDALSHQARFERSKHGFRAQEACLNLLNVYTKPPIVRRTIDLLGESQLALQKFREAGVDIPVDPSDFKRRQIQAAERYVEIQYNQNRLNDGLEVLLNVHRAPDEPIWPNFTSRGEFKAPREDVAIEWALRQRGDLLALELLAAHPDDVSGEVARGLGDGGAMMGAGVELPSPPKLLQCLLKQEVESLKQSIRCERQRQLLSLVEDKREQIRLEVRHVYHAMARHEQTLELKLQQLSELRRGLEAAAEAKDVRQIDFKGRLEQQIQELELISGIVDELVALEIERARWSHVVGETLRP